MYSPEQFTERYGCASHSDFNPQDLWTTNDIIQHEKLAADAERKKVLDDVIGFAKINSDFINKGQDGYAVIRLVTLVQICEKLREGKDGE